MPKPIRQLVVFILLYHVTSGVYSQTVQLQGRVLDTAGKALPFSTVRVPELDIQTTSATNGNFTLSVPGNLKRFQLEITHVGKETITRTVSPGVSLSFILRDKSLTLAEVEVSVTRKGGATPSSILFNRETIEQIQAFSIADEKKLILPKRKLLSPNRTCENSFYIF